MLDNTNGQEPINENDKIPFAVQELRERFAKKFDAINPKWRQEITRNDLKRLVASLPRETDLHKLFTQSLNAAINIETDPTVYFETCFNDNTVNIKIDPQLLKNIDYPTLLKWLAHEFGHRVAPENTVLQNKPIKYSALAQKYANRMFSFCEENRNTKNALLPFIKQTVAILSSSTHNVDTFFKHIEKITKPIKRNLVYAEERKIEFFCDEFADWLVPEVSMRIPPPSKNPLPLPHTNPLFRAYNAAYEFVTGSEKTHPAPDRRMYASEQKLANNSGNMMQIMGKWLSGHARD